ncbi:hypothetical protein DFG55_06350 [Xanthomonas campestris pv. campestris]|nr:hypothetical protein DFG55_06350 [Xanthomonas campestris pv. campestris]QCX69553.1 hypothetical protein DFG54_01020 [Xanthomonas campestris pv. campestris]
MDGGHARKPLQMTCVSRHVRMQAVLPAVGLAPQLLETPSCAAHDLRVTRFQRSGLQAERPRSRR